MQRKPAEVCVCVGRGGGTADGKSLFDSSLCVLGGTRVEINLN